MFSYRDMVVIFIDVMGTKNNTKFEDKYCIHRLFHEEAKANEERNLSHVIYKRNVRSFSDCAYIIYDYKDGIEDFRKDDMKLLQIAMSNTALSVLKILNAGYLVRGGVSFGKAFIDDLGFFGPAIEEAYKLESDYADMPIIALPEELGKRYREWDDKVTDKKLVELLLTSRPYLVEQTDGKYYLNVFYQLEAFSDSLPYEDGSSASLDGIKKTILRVIDRDQKLYPKSSVVSDGCKRKRSSIYEKLEWMKDYILSRQNKLKANVSALSGIVHDV